MSVYRSVCILGRQPAIGLAEIENLYGAQIIRPIESGVLLDIPATQINFKNLGGVIKTAKILTILPYTEWSRLTRYLFANIPNHLSTLPDGKFTLGMSIYGLSVKVGDINRSTLEIKKIIRQSGRAVRVVPNKTLELNSAQVLHNKLTSKGAWELLLIKDGSQTILAQTLFVQDIEAYASRDQARPKRDARVGMLPPKLAQQMINLALPPSAINSQKRIRVLDPFCGTGVVLQEALLMGYDVIGTDIDPRMVDFAKTNIQWLFKQHPVISGHTVIEQADATAYIWPRFSVIASETYLGQPFNKLPPEEKLKQNASNANTIIKKFLVNLAPQLKEGQRLCIAIPAWYKAGGRFVHLPLIDHLTDMGYTRMRFKFADNQDLIYHRENQVVARELLVLQRRK